MPSAFLIGMILALGQPGPSPPDIPAGAGPAADPEDPSATAPPPLEVNAPLMPPPRPAAPPPAPAAPPATPSTPRWFLMRELQGNWLGALLDGDRVSISGWTDGSYTGSTDRHSNLPVAYNDRANTFLVQQQWIRLDRALVTDGPADPSWGYHLDVLIGSDYRWTLERGLLNSQLQNSTGAQNLYGVDPIQFYACAYFPALFRGTEFRVGHTFNPWGYESLEAVSTPFMSHSYTFFNTPFTVMAVGAYPTFTREWSGAFLLTSGDDTFLGPASEARFFGKLTYAAANQRDNLQLGCSLGRGRFNAGAPFAPATLALAQEPAGHNNENALDVVYSHTFSPAFTYVNESMYSWQTAVPANVPGGIVRTGTNSPGTAHWASMCQYFRFTLSPQVGSILRVELFDDFNGQRTGAPGLYTAITGGVQFRPRPALLIRPEVRFDYNGESRPFEGHHGLLTAGSDFIVRW